MNKLTISRSKDAPLPDGVMEMWLTEYAEGIFKEAFEIEMMQGERKEVIENGQKMIWYRIEADPEKMRVFKESLYKVLLEIEENNN